MRPLQEVLEWWLRTRTLSWKGCRSNGPAFLWASGSPAHTGDLPSPHSSGRSLLALSSPKTSLQRFPPSPTFVQAKEFGKNKRPFVFLWLDFAILPTKEVYFFFLKSSIKCHGKITRDPRENALPNSFILQIERLTTEWSWSHRVLEW